MNVVPLISICTLLAWGSFGFVSLAQEPSFEISITPFSDRAISGQPFTYTVVVTNVSQSALGNVFVNIDIPDGTKLVGTRHSSLKWYGGHPMAEPDIRMDHTTLFSREQIEAGEVFSFAMIVEILPETDHQIALESYNSVNLDGDLLASGSTIETEVVTPTPAFTPGPSPSPTLLGTATPSPAATVSSALPAAAGPGGVTSTPSPELSAAGNDDEASAPEPANTPDNWGPVIAIVVLAGLTLGGIVWFLKKR